MLEQLNKETLQSKGINHLFAYSRKSRDIDEEGLKKHNDIIQQLADQLEIPLTIYEEVDSSETLNRPMLNRLREDIRNKKVKGLIVYRMDRLSRKVTDTERLLKEFNFHGLVLIEAHRSKIVDFNETLGIKLEAMMSDLYQEQAKMVLLAGRQKAISLYGNHLGEAPFGYTYNKETKKLEPNQDAWIVKEIFDLYLKGYSTNKIAVMLNKKGLKTKDGCIFRGKAVWNVLQNEKYKGLQIFGKEEWYRDGEGNHFRKERPKEDWLVYEKAHEPIVDVETFEAVQIKLESNRKTPHSARSRKFALTQIVKCGKCGYSLTLYKSPTKAEPNKVLIRRCVKLDFENGSRCGNKGIKQSDVESILLNVLWNDIRPVVLKATKEVSKTTKLVNVNTNERELKELTRQRNQLNKQIDNLIDLQLDMGKSERLINKMNQLESQIEFLNEKIKKLDVQDENDDLIWIEQFLNDSKDLIGLPFSYRGMTDTDKNIFLEKFFKKVFILDVQVNRWEYSDEVNVLMNLKFPEPEEIQSKAVND